MKLYHGTTLDKARLIERDGLMPKAEFAFHIKRESFIAELLGVELPSLRELEQAGVNVYVTDDPFRALYFAEFRAGYERADNGEELSTGYVKQTDYKNPSAEPAVVELDVPHEIWDKLQDDPHASDAWVYPGVIPARYVSAVKPVQFFKLDQDFPMQQIEQLKQAALEKAEAVAA